MCFFHRIQNQPSRVNLMASGVMVKSAVSKSFPVYSSVHTGQWSLTTPPHPQPLGIRGLVRPSLTTPE